MKILIVGEYNESYTGGSIVFVGTRKDFINSRSDIITNDLHLELYNFQRELYKNCEVDDSGGPSEYNEKQLISFEKVKDVIKNLSGKAQEIILESTKSKIHSDGWNGYDKNRLRADWMIHDWKLPEGIYIVFEGPVVTDRSGVISNTYYCA